MKEEPPTFAEIHRMRVEHFRGPVEKKTYYKPDDRPDRERRSRGRLRLFDPARLEDGEHEQ